jgi:hypothetical protein
MANGDTSIEELKIVRAQGSGFSIQRWLFSIGPFGTPILLISFLDV